MDKSATGVTILITILFAALVLLVVFHPSEVFAGDHGEGGELEHKVDLENQSGINLIIAQLYNDNRLLFAIAVTATMAVMGVIIGQITGFLLRMFGLK